MDLERDPRLPGLIDPCGQIAAFLFGGNILLRWLGDRIVNLGDGVGAGGDHATDRGANLFLVLHFSGRDTGRRHDPWAFDGTAFDPAFQFEYSGIVVASRLHRRDPGLQKLTHAAGGRFGQKLVRRPLDQVAVIVDVARDDGHARPVDAHGTRRGRLGWASFHSRNSPIPQNDVAVFDHSAGADNDPSIRHN